MKETGAPAPSFHIHHQQGAPACSQRAQQVRDLRHASDHGDVRVGPSPIILCARPGEDANERCARIPGGHPVCEVVSHVEDLLGTDAQGLRELAHGDGGRLRIIVEREVAPLHGIELVEQRAERPAGVLEASAGEYPGAVAHVPDLVEGFDGALERGRLVHVLAFHLQRQVLDLAVDLGPFVRTAVCQHPVPYRSPQALRLSVEVDVIERDPVPCQDHAVHIGELRIVDARPHERSVHVESDGLEASVHTSRYGVADNER